MGRILALLSALIGALLWALLSLQPPAPLDIEAPPTKFSAGRAFVHVEAIARKPHPVGSVDNARVRTYLTGRIGAIGAEFSEQAFPLSPKALERLGTWSGRKEAGEMGHNLIGLIRGADPGKPAVLLMAHHDSVWGSPGAADDGMALAAALEVARAIKARGQPRRDLILLFTDGEEIGLEGATAFFTKHPLASRIGMIINMEARGSGGRVNMFETGPGNGAQMRLYADKVERPATNSLAVLIYDLMPNSTDYTVAKQRGIPGFNFAVLDRPWSYHSPLATAASLDPRSLQDMGDQALALGSALAFADRLPGRTPNAAFADILGRATIVYPAWGGWVILLVAAGLIGAALRRARSAARTVGRGMILTVAILLHGALLLTAVNALSGSGSSNYYDRLAAIPRLETIAALLVAALLMLLGHLRRPENRLIAIMVAMALMWVGLLSGGPLIVTVVIALATMGLSWIAAAPSSPLPSGESEGAVLLLLIISAVVQATLPTAAPLLQWPLLLASVSLAARRLLPPRSALVTGAAAAAIGVGHLLVQAHFIFLGVGAEMPGIVILLWFAARPLLLPLWPERIPGWLPGIALGAALLLALWVRLDPMAPSVPDYSLANPVKTKD